MFHIYTIILTGKIKVQKNSDNWILTNDIPIEMRKIAGKQETLIENILLGVDACLLVQSIICVIF